MIPTAYSVPIPPLQVGDPVIPCLQKGRSPIQSHILQHPGASIHQPYMTGYRGMCTDRAPIIGCTILRITDPVMHRGGAKSVVFEVQVCLGESTFTGYAVVGVLAGTSFANTNVVDGYMKCLRPTAAMVITHPVTGVEHRLMLSLQGTHPVDEEGTSPALHASPAKPRRVAVNMNLAPDKSQHTQLFKVNGTAHSHWLIGSPHR